MRVVDDGVSRSRFFMGFGFTIWIFCGVMVVDDCGLMVVVAWVGLMVVARCG